MTFEILKMTSIRCGGKLCTLAEWRRGGRGEGRGEEDKEEVYSLEDGQIKYVGREGRKEIR